MNDNAEFALLVWIDTKKRCAKTDAPSKHEKQIIYI